VQNGNAERFRSFEIDRQFKSIKQTRSFPG